MLNTGEIIRGESGRNFTIRAFLGRGGQGIVYTGENTLDGAKVVVKLYNPELDTPATRSRLDRLMALGAAGSSPLALLPIDRFRCARGLGHIDPFSPGISLEAFLEAPGCDLQSCVFIGLQIAQAFALLHASNVTHGDPQANNVLIEKRGDCHHVLLIDFDNAIFPGGEPPPCVGHNLYMAPELRSAFSRGTPAVPCCASDVFGLAVLLHEVILQRHPAAGLDSSESEFDRAMTAGLWAHDPGLAVRPNSDVVGGYPSEVLDSELSRLLRLSFSKDPARRPTASVWVTTLQKALFKMFSCPRCGGQVVIDSSKLSCPYAGCRKPYPLLGLSLPGRTILLNDGTTVVGREHFGGLPGISRRHVVLSREGPEVWMEDISTSGTYRWNDSKWVCLEHGKKALLQAGDTLAIGGMVVRVTQTK
ncbi:MAG: protein kinase [Candidatus Riflebacteria bacterium]|nr:protein kinase [Candidatus Riflebacteria bacterium]